jgi:tetratricopeptide (TPR) repeat protein
MLRRNAHRSLVAAVLVLAAQIALAQAWAGRGRAQGVVRDEAGNPIAGATVTLRLGEATDGPPAVTTNDRGRWAAGGLAGGDWVAVIEKEGYIPAQGPVHVNEFGAAEAFEVRLKASPYAAIDVGDRLLEEGKSAEARAEYEKALPGLEPDRAARLTSRIGDTYFAEGNYDAARGAYEEALPLIPAEEQAHLYLQLATIHERQGDTTAARAELERVLPLLPEADQARVLLMIARGYDAENDRASAIAALERALAIEPENAQLLQVIADLLSREGRDAEAEAYLARVPEDTDVPPDLLLNQGIRHYNEGDMQEALRQFDRVVQQDPDGAEARYYRGLAYLGLQRNAEARADLEKYLDLEPDGPHAAEAREFLAYLESSQ